MRPTAVAALGLLAEVADEWPLLCLVDDAQWLDSASRQVLGFVARRLLSESVLMVFAVREPTDKPSYAGLPELELSGLAEQDARAFLEAVVPGRLDDRVRDRVVAETRGNPRALLELSRGMTAAELAGGFVLPDAGDPPGQIEERYLQRHGELSEATQRLLLLAAADPTGDAALLWRAAQTLGTERPDATPAATRHLLEIGGRVQFRHPLVRSAVYRGAPQQDRRSIHRALAAATDPRVDPDRRAWHRAAAAPGPDEEVASELEQSVGRAQARGGLAAAAAFLQHAVALTRDPARRTDRARAAARAHLHAGAFGPALGLLARAESGAVDELQRARVEVLRGQIAFASGGATDAPALLLQAAKRLEPIDGRLARETYLDAWGAALFAGRVATAGGLLEVSRAARSGPPAPHPPRPADLLLDGLAALITDGRTTAAPILRRAASAFAAMGTSGEEGLRWGWLTTVACDVFWDDETWRAIIARQLRLARDAGALAWLPIDLTASAMLVAWWGDFARSAELIAEADAVTQATGTSLEPYGAMLLAALRGREAEAQALIEATIDDDTAGGRGIGVHYARSVAAILFNGLGRYDDALAVAQQASDDTPEQFLPSWALPELIEAATRSGLPRLGGRALDALTEATSAAGTDWGLGIAARSRALMSEGEAAEDSYREAIDRLSRTRLRTGLARAHLLYGEWLRRENRRADAREQLRIAHDMLTGIGMEAFAERARHELLATGERVRRRRNGSGDGLTPQEAHIARLARDGSTNPEIGATLYISARTVEWHLRKVFAKLGISSRKDLQDALPTGAPDATPA